MLLLDAWKCLYLIFYVHSDCKKRWKIYAPTFSCFSDWPWNKVYFAIFKFVDIYSYILIFTFTENVNILTGLDKNPSQTGFLSCTGWIFLLLFFNWQYHYKKQKSLYSRSFFDHPDRAQFLSSPGRIFICRINIWPILDCFVSHPARVGFLSNPVWIYIRQTNIHPTMDC